MSTLTFQVTGMSCSHCENAIEKEVQALPGVQALEVNAQTGVLSVTACPDVTPEAILAAVDEAGFSASVSS